MTLESEVLHALRERYGDLTLRQREPFEVLSRSIIAQQISTKAADTIRARFQRLYRNDPYAVAAADPEDLRCLGISSSKTHCLQRVAALILAGSLSDLATVQDEVISQRLRQIPGIGPWTVDMFLIFCVARPDIWPVSDGGLRAA